MYLALFFNDILKNNDVALNDIQKMTFKFYNS